MPPYDNMPVHLLDVPDGVYGDIEAFMTCFESPETQPDLLMSELPQRLADENAPIAEIPKDENNLPM